MFRIPTLYWRVETQTMIHPIRDRQPADRTPSPQVRVVGSPFCTQVRQTGHCLEAQADGVPCCELRCSCEVCERNELDSARMSRHLSSK